MSKRISRATLVVLLGGALSGIIFWGGFNTVVEQTNSLAFCTSCHEMSYVYEEYRESIHYKNASGVRAICSDCHVPREWLPKMVRKVQASNELYHKMIGTIDTREKFEARRLEMAEHVWETMRATDSRECRNCHSFESMDFHKQERRAAEKMQKVVDKKTGETCIECHKGIAHKLPEGYDGDDD
jgi:nitrate/TMAO reductase-like tetraheme cytochrome c subunit